MTESRICACGCGKVFHRGDMNLRRWVQRKYATKACKSNVSSRKRRERFKHSGFVMVDYTPPSQQAAEVANFFLYKQKPWTTEADLTG